MNAPCYLHVGTHKTGTTAIQRFLADNERELAAAGLYVPVAGRRSEVQPGHHNLASEVYSMASLVAGLGGLREVAAEIARVRPASVCLSSEEFSLRKADTAEALARVRDTLASIGYAARIVLYVRAQDAYLESLYSESLKHGYTFAFPKVVDAVLTSGRFEAFGFVVSYDFVELANAFADVFGRDAIDVRGYVPSADANPLIKDFLAAVGLSWPRLGRLPAAPVHVNHRLTTGAAIRRTAASVGARDGTSRIAAAAARYVASRPDLASVPLALLNPSDRERIRARFASSNAVLVREYGVAQATFDYVRAAETEREQAAREFFFAAPGV